jgi:predicted nucleic acid-binding Zn ribbon protein
MPRHPTRAHDYEDEDEDADDREAPDEWDQDDPDDDEESDTVDCPRCGRPISEFAQQCPRCGAYVSAEEPRRTQFPTWVVVTAIILVATIVLGWLGGAF